jgi:tetratricopeptide (TPR) repeat protein
MSDGDAVQRAVALAKAGRRERAREILRQILQKDTDNISAWVAMAQLSGSRVEAIYCLQQVLRLRPDNPWATTHIRRLSSMETTTQPHTEPVEEEKITSPPEEEALPEDDLFAKPGFFSSSDDFPFEPPPTADVEGGEQDLFIDPFADISPDVGEPRKRGLQKGSRLRAILLAILVLVVIVAVALWQLGLLPG